MLEHPLAFISVQTWVWGVRDEWDGRLKEDSLQIPRGI